LERRPHPTHGRILQVTLTNVGRRNLEAAPPAVRELEREAKHGYTAGEITIVKTCWSPPGTAGAHRAVPTRLTPWQLQRHPLARPNGG
jgi:hypothetical protein